MATESVSSRAGEVGGSEGSGAKDVVRRYRTLPYGLGSGESNCQWLSVPEIADG